MYEQYAQEIDREIAVVWGSKLWPDRLAANYNGLKVR